MDQVQIFSEQEIVCLDGGGNWDSQRPHRCLQPRTVKLACIWCDRHTWRSAAVRFYIIGRTRQVSAEEVMWSERSGSNTAANRGRIHERKICYWRQEFGRIFTKTKLHQTEVECRTLSHESSVITWLPASIIGMFYSSGSWRRGGGGTKWLQWSGVEVARFD